MADVARFHCPTCNTLLGKGDGSFLQTYCRRCHIVKTAPAQLQQALRELVNGTCAVPTGRK